MPESEIKELRREIAETAEKISLAYETKDVAMFHLYLGMITGLGMRLYEANARAER